jgi:hypothetical protein
MFGKEKDTERFDCLFLETEDLKFGLVVFAGRIILPFWGADATFAWRNISGLLCSATTPPDCRSFQDIHPYHALVLGLWLDLSPKKAQTINYKVQLIRRGDAPKGIIRFVTLIHIENEERILELI